MYDRGICYARLRRLYLAPAFPLNREIRNFLDAVFKGYIDGELLRYNTEAAFNMHVELSAENAISTILDLSLGDSGGVRWERKFRTLGCYVDIKTKSTTYGQNPLLLISGFIYKNVWIDGDNLARNGGSKGPWSMSE